MELSIKPSLGVRPLVTVKLTGKTDIIVDISKAINRRELTNKENSYSLLVGALKYNKKEEIYYNLTSALFKDIVNIDEKDLTPRLVELSSILTHDEIEAYLVSINYKSPVYLMDVFNDNIIKNNEGSREQTYTKADYRDLVILTIKLKLISLILARYVYIYEIDINKGSSIKLYRAISSIPDIANLPAFEKLASFVDKNIGGDDTITEVDISRVMTKGITRLKFGNFITTAIMMYLGISGDVNDDTDRYSLVSEMSRLCKNKNSVTKNMMINNLSLSADDDDGNGSVMDTYLSVSPITIGTVEEILYSYDTLDKIIRQVKHNIDPAHLETAKRVIPILVEKRVDKLQNVIMSWLFFDCIEVEYIKSYFTKEIKANLRGLSYAILKTAGINNLADVMLSTIYESGIFMAKTNNTTLPPELDDALTKMYSLVIDKKSRAQSYGLSILGNDSNLDSVKDRFTTPVINRLSNSRWLAHHQEDAEAFTVPNAAEEVVRTLILSHSVLPKKQNLK